MLVIQQGSEIDKLFERNILLSSFNYISVVCFYFHCCRSWVKKILVWFLLESVLPMFSCKSFILYGFTFRSVINFEFIFVYGVRKCSNFILDIAVQFSQHYLLRRLFFSIVHSCLLCDRLGDLRCVGLSLDFLSCSTGLYFCFCASTIVFWWL